jgi:hypothetical protein
MTRKQKPPSWQDWASLPKNFCYDVDAPIEDVIQALAELGKKRGFFSATYQDMSIIPSGDTYQFRMRQKANVTATAEGSVWEDKAGSHVEGQAHVNGWTIIFPSFVIALSMLSLNLTSPLDITLLALVIFGASFYIHRQNRQTIIDKIENAVGKAMLNSHLQKQKRTPNKGQRRLSSDSNQVRESIWDETVSEQDDRQERRK